MLGVLFHGIWQGAAVFAIAYVVVCCVPRRNAATRYAVWFAALLALVAVPIFTVFSSTGALLLAAMQPRAASGTWTISLLPAQSLVRDAAGILTPATPWIVAVWLTGATACLVRLGLSLAHIGRIRKNAVALADARDVLISSDVAIPIAIGLFKSAIVVPKTLYDTLGRLDLERIIAHERAHVLRRDVAGNLVQRLIEAILFFNPWVHLVGRHLVLEREAACDDWAVRKTGASQEYAAFLASLAASIRRPQGHLATPSALGSRHALVKRIERLAGSAVRPVSLNYYVIGGTVMLFVVLTLALEAFSPALALAPVQPVALREFSGTDLLAAACAKPNVDAAVTSPAEPKPPHGLRFGGSATVAVTIAPNGNVVHTSIWKSSGNAQIDRSVADAAAHSKYSPKLVNCNPVEGNYLFKAEFTPSQH